MDWYIKVVKDNYANFSGRARRKEYWMFFLFNIIFGSITEIIDLKTGANLLNPIYTTILFIPGLAVAVRRLHDIGKSGWMLLIMLIPIIGIIWLIILLCKEGNTNENQYGPDPKQEQNIPPATQRF